MANQFTIVSICSVIFVYSISADRLFAQVVNDSDHSEKTSYFLEPVIVTAEKREANVQETPIAITTFSGRDIDYAGIIGIPDLALRTPGLVIGNNSNLSSPEMFIRGVGTTDFSTGSDLSIGIYLDDVYIGRPEAMFIDFIDIERVEVLRGPQSTLYGRNAIGGAINVISRKPTPEFEAIHRITYGNFDLVNVKGSMAGPLLGETILGRLSYGFKDRDGYTNNEFNGNRLADADSYSSRGSLWWLPTDELDILLSIDYLRDRPAALAFKSKAVDNPNLSDFGHFEPNDSYKVNHDTDGLENREVFGVSAKTNWTTDDFTIVSISSFRRLNNNGVDDVDGSSVPILNFVRDLENQQFSQELRLANKDTGFTWIVGAYYFFEDSNDINILSLPSLDTTDTNIVSVEAGNFATYAQGTLTLTSKLYATAGLRYSIERKKFDIDRVVNDAGTIITLDANRGSETDSWEAWTPKIGLHYLHSDDLMLYGTVSRGFRSGGFDSLQREDAFVDSFDPEFLTAYEVGTKSRWLQGRLQANLSFFFYDHKDLQVPTVVSNNGTLTTVTTNAPEATNYGAELEVIGKPVDGLEVIGGLGLLNTEYDDLVIKNNAQEKQDVSGNKIIRSPELTTNLAIQYRINLANNGAVIIRGEHQYQSKYYFTVSNEADLSQRGYHNLNARITYESQDRKLAITAFGNNLTDKESINVAFDLLREDTGSIIRTFNAPRTYGLELTVRF